MSAESSSKVQLQLILVSDTQLNFHFTGEREKALAQRNKCKELLQQLLQQVYGPNIAGSPCFKISPHGPPDPPGP